MSHSWIFQRIGGLDQVIFSDSNDIINLPDLDPKLWMVLSCPTKGLDFDQKTLSLLDSDQDGHIRIPDVLDAIAWTNNKLTSLDSILSISDTLSLSQIDHSTENGKKLLITAQSILANLNKNDCDYLTQVDVQKSVKINAEKLYNGDAIFPPSNELTEQMRHFIESAIKTVGAEKDSSGQDGITLDIATTFVHDLKVWQNWQIGINQIDTSFGEKIAEIWKLMQCLKPKIDDYFLRTELAEYAPQAQTVLNVDEKFIVPNENGLLTDDVLSELPLSKIEAGKALDLINGLNPLWRSKITRFTTLIATYLSKPNQLKQQEWETIQNNLAPYTQFINSKPKPSILNVTIAPTASIDELPQELIQQILHGDFVKQFELMVVKDNKAPISASDVLTLEKLVLFNKYLYRLLVNFASFADFFSFETSADFQLGKLYIDGRCATLCVFVNDVAKHSALANYSELCLLYCECTRQDQKQIIAAAITAGSSDLLMEGRNGIFIDNSGSDWDATVIKMITKPISIRQAIVAPYQRIGRFVTEQINKWASHKESSVTSSSAQTVENTTTKFDIGKSVGIFAAIGLAIGAIGTAFASLFQAVFKLEWWQFPLVFIGLFLIISGPSVILAWLKLRRRTLGPLLEASGWAINGRVKISLLLGNILTTKAQLPDNAKRSLKDPMKRRSKKVLWFLLLTILIGIAFTGSWLWRSEYLNSYFELTKQEQIQN